MSTICRRVSIIWCDSNISQNTVHIIYAKCTKINACNVLLLEVNISIISFTFFLKKCLLTRNLLLSCHTTRKIVHIVESFCLDRLFIVINSSTSKTELGNMQIMIVVSEQVYIHHAFISWKVLLYCGFA